MVKRVSWTTDTRRSLEIGKLVLNVGGVPTVINGLSTMVSPAGMIELHIEVFPVPVEDIHVLNARTVFDAIVSHRGVIPKVVARPDEIEHF